MKPNPRYWKKRKVLVTGHEGFLGSWLTKTLVENGATVVGLDTVSNRPFSVLNGSRKKFKAVKGSVADFILVKRIIQKFRPQTIFHLAAEAIVRQALANPLRCFQSNIEGTWNILEVSRSQKFIEAIVAASSDKAYGSHKKLPYDEHFALQGEHPYDVSKSCADLLCRAYSHTYGVPVAVTRCGNIYGPGDYHVSRIVPDGVQSAIQSKPLKIRSDGKFTRDYIYVEDIVFAYILLAEKMKSLQLAGQAFNFSDENPISVLQLFKTISKLAASQTIQPLILNQARYEIRHQFLSSAKARKILQWKPHYTLEEGLRKTILWYRNNLSLQKS